MRAPSSGRKLNNSDAALVKGMISRGDRQHDIAAVFAVNGGRIGETSTGENFAGVAPATTNLPPQAPYLVVSANLRVLAKALQKELEAIGSSPGVLAQINEIVAAFDQSHAMRRGK